MYKNFIYAPLPPGSTIGASGKGFWPADTKNRRFKMICWGVAICGVVDVMVTTSALPPMLTSGKAIDPFALSLYMLSIGAAQFKPSLSPTVMNQSPHKVAHIITDEKDRPEAAARKLRPGQRVYGARRRLRAWRLKCIGHNGFWDIGKPSVRKAAGSATEYGHDDEFPIWRINDGALGAAASALTAGMDTNGLPNGLLDNLNSVSIVISGLPEPLIISKTPESKSVMRKLKYMFSSVVPIMNHIIYPLLRSFGMK
ncbi:hypothetical protein DL764_007914 [Monosporascus ibericus]|uniref:Uncharacterized protein n=1 Tax=Monosporascus ibericus TaxID=155417 RepID=A0A4Q4T294_9PEZI|nr:hypothetical protein DL764_007914 [Monosporascus ibericus]